MKREKIHVTSKRHWALMDEKSFCPTCGATPGYPCKRDLYSPLPNNTVHASRVEKLSHNTRTF